MSAIPRQIGPYRIVSVIGSGGMGQVFRAFDPRLQREVAVKLLPPEYQSDPVRKLRFEQEARAVAALNHPNILSVYDVGDGWMVTELIEGESLHNARLSPRQLVDAGAQIADGLATAHEAGITHRDLKPDNVLLTRDGRPKILDFGLAKFHDRAPDPVGAQTVTVPGTVMGTPGYMAPEQVRGLKADHRADLFALGVILYEQLAAKRAFDGPSFADVLSATLNQDPPELPESIPAGLRQIVRRCIDKKPEQRFQSARDLAFALRNLSMQSTATGTQTGLAPPPTKAEPRWLWPAVAGIALLAGTAGWLLWATNPGSRQTDFHFRPFGSGARFEEGAAWSPDGKSVVYLESSEGVASLVVKSMEGSAPVVVVPNVSITGSPRWPGDGARIYYVSLGALMAVSPSGGQPEKVIEKNVIAADISPDGKTVAFWQSTESKDGRRSSLWIASPPRATAVEYLPAPFTIKGSHIPVYVRFSPDGRSIYLSSWSGRDTVAEVWLLPLPSNSGLPKRLLSKLQLLGSADGTWLPDSRRIILSAGIRGRATRDLFLAHTDSDSLTRLLAWPENVVAPAASPDGKSLLFSQGVRDQSLVELPLDGSPIRNLLATRHDENSIDWFPDGDRFLYVTSRNGSPELLVGSAKTKWDRQLLPRGNAYQISGPIVSPEGSRIAYWGHSTDSNGLSIYVLPVAGGSPARIADGSGVSWSPDGTSLVFFWRKPDGISALATIRLGLNATPVPVISPHDCASPPEWSPSGEWIACTSIKGVLLYSPDGKKTRTLPVMRSIAIAWSKDSKTIYGVPVENSKRLLVAMDATTGTIRQIADYGQSSETVFAVPNSYGLRLSRSPDGKSLATTRVTSSSDLWIIDNFGEQLR